MCEVDFFLVPDQKHSIPVFSRDIEQLGVLCSGDTIEYTCM